MLTAIPELVPFPNWLGQSTLVSNRNEVSVRITAVSLYDRARNQGWHESIRSRLSGSPLHLLKPAPTPGCGHDAGLQTVSIWQIRGSENRCSDFDAKFHPLQSRTRDRWVNIAAARLMGAMLPPVELIQVGDIYYVRDGHHRISVARAIGEEYIEGHITIWAK